MLAPSPRTKKFIRLALSIGLALVMMIGAYHFLRDIDISPADVRRSLGSALPLWLWLGFGLSVLDILVHALQYQSGLRALGRQVPLGPLTLLYLKRTAAGVFLPAGGITSQALFSSTVTDRYTVSEAELGGASGIYSVSGIISSVLLIVPALAWLFRQDVVPAAALQAFCAMIGALLLLVWAFVHFFRKGKLHEWAEQKMPNLARHLKYPDWSRFDRRQLWVALMWAFVVEAIGVAHLWVAAQALGIPLSLSTAFAGYLTVLVVTMTSPFLKGAGAAEALLIYVLMQYGLDTVAAAAVAALYRLLQFWGLLTISLPTLLIRPGRRPEGALEPA